MGDKRLLQPKAVRNLGYTLIVFGVSLIVSTKFMLIPKVSTYVDRPVEYVPALVFLGLGWILLFVSRDRNSSS